MKLPHREYAKIEESKIVDYLLSSTHEDGRHKAAFFVQFGFTVAQWPRLAEALIQHIHENEIASVTETSRGEHFTVEGELETPSGRRPLVRTVWMIEFGSKAPRLITTYPLRSRRQS